MKKFKKIISGTLAASILFLTPVPVKWAAVSAQTNEGNYVVISNESTDIYESESTGTFNYSQAYSNITKNASLDSSSYMVDADLPFDYKKYKSKALINSNKATAKKYEVGNERKFWVTHMSTDEDYQITAKLLYSGTKANVWVHEDEISQSDAEKLGKEFDQNIYPLVVNNFAKESDVDKDGKINILCFDIQDDFDETGVYTGGYFYSRDLYDMNYSNYSEIFYMDTYPSMGRTTKDVTKVYSTLAHEFQHMVNFNQNVFVEDGFRMESWLNEALSMAAEQMYTGKPLTSRINYYNNSESIKKGHPLMYWGYGGDTLSNYALSYLFGQYIKVQAGKGDSVFKEILEDEEYFEEQSIENVIKKYIDPTLTYEEFMTNFRIALLLNQTTGYYGFKDYSGFNAIKKNLYTGGATNLVGSGAIAKKISTDDFEVPSDKGANVTYTFINNDEVVFLNDLTMTSDVSDQDTVIKGKTKPEATVYVNADSTKIASKKADLEGNFEIEIPKQKAGTLLTIYSKDSSGNLSPKVKISVADKTAPEKPTVNQVADNTAIVTGKAEAKAAVYVKAGTKEIGKGTANDKGEFSITLSAKQKAGTTLTIYAEDKAGNKSEEVFVTVADKTAPSKPTVNTVADNAAKVTGKAEANSTVYVKAGSKTWKAAANSKGEFSIAISKQKAGTVLTVYAIDKAGNKSAEAKVTVVDKTAPAVSKVNTVGDNVKKVTGKTEAGATVYVKAGSKQIGKGTANSKGEFTVAISSKQKAGTVLTVYAVDKAKNKSKEVKVKVADKTAPAVPTVKKVTSKTKKVTGKAEKNATVYIYKGSKIIGKAKVSSKGTFSVKIPAQKKGTVLKVYAVDKAKNKSKAKTVKVK